MAENVKPNTPMLKRRESLLETVHMVAMENGVHPFILDALIQVESSYDTLAIRYEPLSKSESIPKKYAKINMISEDTEIILQKMSWGLAQVMGSTARWLGYSGNLMLLAIDPSLGLKWACAYLDHLHEKFHEGDLVIAAYNAGTPRRNPDGSFKNQRYVDAVMRIYNGLVAEEQAKAPKKGK